MRSAKPASLVLLLLAAAFFAAAFSGCGDSKSDKPAAQGETTESGEAAEQGETAEGGGKVPRSLGTVESGAEDTIDFAHADDRAKVVATTRKLRHAAEGPAAKDLKQAGVPADQIAELRALARLLEQLAPRGDFARISLAANQISGLMPDFYARYDDPVPPAVLELDYLDREAQLRSIAGDRSSARTAVAMLTTTWAGLRSQVLKAGGSQVAAKFTRHVAAMRRLAKGSDDKALQKEAVSGLELVDELEQQFRRH